MTPSTAGKVVMATAKRAANSGQFKKGDAKKGGRKKGSVNKTTALLKDAILQAAQDAGGGGQDGMVKYLTEQADKNPGPFMTLLGKVLPMQVAGDPDNPIETVHRIELVAPKQ